MKNIHLIKRKFQLIINWIIFIYGDLLAIQPKQIMIYDAPELLETAKLERAVRHFNLKKRGVV